MISMSRDELNESNLQLYAAKHYYDPKRQYIDAEEFNEDFNRLKYIKRLLNRYSETGVIADRLILNHLIVISNVFGIQPMLRMLEVKIPPKHWPALKPFLIMLRYIRNDQYTEIQMDAVVVEVLRKI